MTGYIHSVETLGAADGPGIRYVVFFKGCPLRCAYCHNPDTWEESGGTAMTEQELLDDILKYKYFIKNGGVTFSGGEPLMQWEFCEAVCKELHAQGISVAVDTSGAVPLSLCRSLIAEADLLLLDIKAMDTGLCKRITGQGNEHALEILQFREEINKPVWIRHVVVPGLTLEEDNLSRMAAYLKDFSCIERVDLLPFHQLGQYKWENLRLNYTLKDTQPPTDEEMQWAAGIFAEKGITVRY
ncbi:MAG: pyruvate formate lyase-activating protein [Clostridia bacterium]|nr:pyruvate formate lyase-activating protein [Clostridia bacterium]